MVVTIWIMCSDFSHTGMLRCTKNILEEYKEICFRKDVSHFGSCYLEMMRFGVKSRNNVREFPRYTLLNIMGVWVTDGKSKSNSTHKQTAAASELQHVWWIENICESHNITGTLGISPKYKFVNNLHSQIAQINISNDNSLSDTKYIVTLYCNVDCINYLPAGINHYQIGPNISNIHDVYWFISW